MWRRAGSVPNHIKALRVWGHINGETTSRSYVLEHIRPGKPARPDPWRGL